MFTSAATHVNDSSLSTTTANAGCGCIDAVEEISANTVELFVEKSPRVEQAETKETIGTLQIDIVEILKLYIAQSLFSKILTTGI